MGSSSSGKKHKKEKKHRHRSDSRDENRDTGTDDNNVGALTLDLTVDAEENDADDSSSTSRARHHHHHKHKKQHKEHRHKHNHKHRERERRTEVISVEESESDSSDCVEVIVEKPEEGEQEFSAPPPPVISRHADYEREQRERDCEREKERDRERQRGRDRERERAQRERDREREQRERDREREREREKDRDRDRQRELERRREREAERDRYEREREREIERRRERDVNRERESRKRACGRERSRSNSKSHSFSPVPENGAGDVLSIEETNKLRAKLGLKPLEVDAGPNNVSTNSTQDPKRLDTEKNLASYKDEWGEFLHKPADNIKEKKEAEKLREKLKQRKEKRYLEERLARICTLGESDEETDDVNKWVERNKRVVDQRKEAELRAKALEELDAEFGVKELVEQEQREERRKAYNGANLKGLTVEHDVDDFTEGRTVILTLKDQEVLNEENGDLLVNVNMIDDARYKKNVANKKLNPQSYGYNVYEEQYDEYGNPIERSILEKYDQDIDGEVKRTKFVIGENLDEEREYRRKLLEIKTKLAGKRLESLHDTNIKLASDTFSAEELAKFKKPKKKVKKLRQKLKADDLLPLAEEQSTLNFGSRNCRRREADDVDDIEMHESKLQIKFEEDEEDLQRVLAKARKLKQKDNIIKKPPTMDSIASNEDIKNEPIDESNTIGATTGVDSNIVLNATAEFCRTLGDIPTYGMAGNRNEDSNDMMDFEVSETQDERMDNHDEIPAQSHGTWNSVNPDEVIQPANLDNIVDDIEERAILDEEPDVGAGVANALRLALSKGYLEKEEKNRPSNSNMAHLQAKNYSIEDKAAGEDEKFGRRDRFHSGPIMDFKDKDSFKPNVKLEYIDDNGRILNLKEAFRYLSHKFHGKGPGKNKIEKRLKKMEQEGLMKTMSSTDTPLGTLTMLQQKQKETKTPYVVLSGSNKTASSVSGASLAKFK